MKEKKVKGSFASKMEILMLLPFFSSLAIKDLAFTK